MNRALISALRMTNLVEEVTASDLESRVHRKLSARPSTSKEITLVSGMTIGRALRLCGATGVIIRLPELGKIITTLQNDTLLMKSIETAKKLITH